MTRTGRIPWTIASVAVAITYLFAHQPAQLVVQRLRSELGSAAFSRLFLALGIVFVSTALIVGLRASRGPTTTRVGTDPAPRSIQGLRVALWVASLVLTFLAHWCLVAVQSELVHLPQYLLLYLMLFASCGKPGQAALWTGLAGIADEAYQYWYLQADWNIYLDWNDIALNLLASALGVSLVLSFGRWRPLRQRLTALFHPAFAAVVALFGSALLLRATGVLGFYRSHSPDAWIVLSRSDAPPDFWTFAEWTLKDFHILSPAEGLVITLTLFILLGGIDALVEKVPASGHG